MNGNSDDLYECGERQHSMNLNILVYPLLTEEVPLLPALQKYVPGIDERMSMWNGAVDELGSKDYLLVVRYNLKHGTGASVPFVDALAEHARERLGERVVVYDDSGKFNGPLLYDDICGELRKSLGPEAAQDIGRIRGYGELDEVFYMTHYVAIRLGVYGQELREKVVLPDELAVRL